MLAVFCLEGQMASCRAPAFMFDGQSRYKSQVGRWQSNEGALLSRLSESLPPMTAMAWCWKEKHLEGARAATFWCRTGNGAELTTLTLKSPSTSSECLSSKVVLRSCEGGRNNGYVNGRKAWRHRRPLSLMPTAEAEDESDPTYFLSTSGIIPQSSGAESRSEPASSAMSDDERQGATQVPVEDGGGSAETAGRELVQVDLELPRRRSQVAFTCNVCSVRTERLLNPNALSRGTVFVQCGGCQAWHKLVDNLGLIVEYDFRKEKIQIEEAAEE